MLLSLVASVDRERDGFHDLPVAGDLGPEPVVVEMTREVLPRRVIDVLYIDEDGHLFQGNSLQTEKVGKRDEQYSYTDEQHHIGHKVWEENQSQPADQRDNRPLLLAIDEKSQPNRAEKQSPE